jgi:predicted dehydrogenase
VLLDYGENEGEKREELPRSVQITTKQAESGPVASRVGFIGAGSFAQGFLIPHIARTRSASLVSVCNSNGLNAANVARTFGFQSATSDPSEIFGNESINTVFVATRHNLHTPLIVQALRAGKKAFVEKPLALTPAELLEIKKVYGAALADGKDPMLMVGFNRRFAPQVQHAKRFFENVVGPYVIQYRVSAGYLPKTHWTRDPIEGGGRIIGEVCHFIDLMQFMTGSSPARVFAESLSSASGGTADDDSVLITIKFEDGSVGTITYLANGDVSVPKERVEVSSTGRTAVIDNFQRLSLFQNGKKREFKLASIDKGHREEVRAFLAAIHEGKPSPIPFESLIATTWTTFKVLESLQVGVPVSL